MSEQMMRQVKLVRPVTGGQAEEVCWIDNAVARLNRRVEDEDGVEWTVAELYGARPFSQVDRTARVAREFAKTLDCTDD